MQTPIWFLTNGTWRLGPLTLDQTIAALQQAEQPVDVWVWRDGMDTWTRPEAVPELAPATGVAPSSIPSPSPAVVVAAPPAPARWFVVGPVKLVVMSTVTLCLYQTYWFYQHWRQVRDVHGEDIWPVPRAIFSPLFCFSLFRRLEDEAATRGRADAPSPGLHAVAFFLLALASRLPPPWFLIAFASVLPLVTIQRAANAIALEAAPGTDPNTRFTGLNWVGIVAGGLVLLLVLIGTMLPQETKAAVSLAGSALRPA